MKQTQRQFTIGDVDQEIRRGFRWLRFSSDFERKFDADNGDDRCKHLILHNYIGLTIYHCFLFSDYIAIRDAFQIDLIMHFLVMTPVMVILNYVLARRPTAWVRESAVSLALVILSFTINAVIASSQSPDAEIVHLSSVLVVLFAIVMQRIQFWFVLPALAVIQLIYLMGVMLFVPVTVERAIMLNSVFFGVTVFSLIGAYNLEYQQRMGYLLRLRDHLRNRELEIFSLRDPLTGLGNRRAMDETLALLASGAPVAAQSTAILLLDIDHFKRYNDKNGHPAGDACLRTIAGLIAASLGQQANHAYRFGGEEFLVILRDTTLGQALVTAEKVRMAVAAACIPQASGSDAIVTVSIGVTAGIISQISAPATLIAAADAALYSAKANGRNRVAVSIDGHLEQAIEQNNLQKAG